MLTGAFSVPRPLCQLLEPADRRRVRALGLDEHVPGLRLELVDARFAAERRVAAAGCSIRAALALDHLFPGAAVVALERMRFAQPDPLRSSWRLRPMNAGQRAADALAVGGEFHAAAPVRQARDRPTRSPGRERFITRSAVRSTARAAPTRK